MMSAMASSSVGFIPAPGQAARPGASPSPPSFASLAFRAAGARVRASRNMASPSLPSVLVVRCRASTTEVPCPTVSETKSNFLRAYSKPIPGVYNTVLQELIMQQHLMRYKRRYQYDPIFALGFVTVYDQLMEGYPSDDDRDAIFRAYVRALKENPDQYRTDANKLEEWARVQNASSLCDFPSREGDVEGVLKDIAQRAAAGGSFSYSRFFAIGLFRLIEMANATEPATVEKLCAALNINKRSVDRDLDVYRNLLTKLVQAKELLKEYVAREKKKREERTENQRADGAVTKCLGEFQSASV